jgi:murein DD-endopeptidase MepM/ murein hydrolase activator NlpD
MAGRRTVSRRAALGLLMAGAAFPVSRAFGSDSNRQFAVDAARPFRLALPALSSEGPNMEVTLSDQTVYQGGAIYVRVNNVAASGRSEFRGRNSPLVASLGGGLEGFVPIGTEDPTGLSELRVEVDSYTAGFEYRAFAIKVLKTNWTVDYIVIPPPDPNDPDPPPPDLPDEQPRLNELYLGVTARKWLPTWVAPVPEPLVVSGYFGEQRSFNGGPVQGHHGGTDFGYAAGTPVLATNSGTVVLAERVRVRGNCVVIDHGGGVFSLYGHMQSLNATVGQQVGQGAVVGYVGSTGLSTGPHLHWELAVAGVLVDGLRWIDGSQRF